ncbi:MAG: competence type IV pilus major pilin ComGC [Microthrixaceae bacterium]
MNMIEKRKEMAGQGGFTLIELLVVIAILAVLGGAAIIGIGQLRGNAETEVCATNLETIELAAEAYNIGENAGATSLQDLIDEGYLKDVPETGTYTVSGTTVTQTACP